MPKNRVLLKQTEMVGGMPVAYHCSHCNRVFPLPSDALTDKQKANKVQAEFDEHDCREDAVEPLPRS